MRKSDAPLYILAGIVLIVVAFLWEVNGFLGMLPPYSFLIFAFIGGPILIICGIIGIVKRRK